MPDVRSNFLEATADTMHRVQRPILVVDVSKPLSFCFEQSRHCTSLNRKALHMAGSAIADSFGTSCAL